MRTSACSDRPRSAKTGPRSSTRRSARTRRPIVRDDPAWLRAQLDGLTTAQEEGRDAPWRVDDAPATFVAGQLPGIVGVEIPIDRLEGKWKASQNQPAANRAGVVAGLRLDDPASPMAEVVEQTG